MTIPLDPHQKDGVGFLQTDAGSKGKLLADEPRLGKTRQAIAACVAAHDQVVNVACPASAIPVWERETQQFAPQIDWRIFSFNKAEDIENRVAWCDTLIIDEAHYLKTGRKSKNDLGSQRTRALFGDDGDGLNGAVASASRIILLTGTPTPNNPSEIWPLARACFPEAIKHPTAPRPMSYWEFVFRYCKVKRDAFGGTKILPRGKRIEELRAKLAPYVLRRRFAEVYPDAMPPRHSLLPIAAKFNDMALGIDSAEYIELAKTLREKGVDGLNAISSHVATLRRLVGMAKVKGVAEWIADWFQSGGGKLVVFAYHQDVIRALHKELEARKVKHVAGGNGSDILFRDDASIQVFLGQVQRDGVAIDLSAARTLLLVEQSWVPGDNDQAWRRIQNRAQTGFCDVRWAALEGSIDEDVAEACRAKASTIAELWDSAD